MTEDLTQDSNSSLAAPQGHEVSSAGKAYSGADDIVVYLRVSGAVRNLGLGRDKHASLLGPFSNI